MIIIDRDNRYIGETKIETEQYFQIELTRYFKDPSIFGAKSTSIPVPKNIDKRFAVLQDGKWIEDIQRKERFEKMKAEREALRNEDRE